MMCTETGCPSHCALARLPPVPFNDGAMLVGGGGDVVLTHVAPVSSFSLRESLSQVKS